MSIDFTQIGWDSHLEAECRRVIRTAFEEDLAGSQDWTTLAMIPPQTTCAASMVARDSGVIAGLRTIPVAVNELGLDLRVTQLVEDRRAVSRDETLVRISGDARHLLTLERTILNLVGHLSGVATLTHRYVEKIAGTQAAIYDTRKTTPGLRRLEKYAVRCGGGRNHRLGLHDAILIKDNHLAMGSSHTPPPFSTPDQAVKLAKLFLREHWQEETPDHLLIEIEVDDLTHFDAVLAAEPDVILLDNMSPDQLAQAVAMRHARESAVQLEASGGIDLRTVQAIARTGVDRISVGALTHSAPQLDVSLDWGL